MQRQQHLYSLTPSSEPGTNTQIPPSSEEHHVQMVDFTFTVYTIVTKASGKEIGTSCLEDWGHTNNLNLNLSKRKEANIELDESAQSFSTSQPQSRRPRSP